MILEGLVTTVSASDEVNLAPMGPIVDESMSSLLLRPFQTSTTYQNLKRQGEGVFHVTDDVLLLARAAIGKVEPLPEMVDAEQVQGKILSGACRWYAFRVTLLDDSQERTHIEAEVVDRGTLREFFGFNRAKHAVLEAAILATRLHILDAEMIRSEFAKLAVIVEKTAGPQEREAMALLQKYVDERLG